MVRIELSPARAPPLETNKSEKGIQPHKVWSEMRIAVQIQGIQDTVPVLASSGEVSWPLQKKAGLRHQLKNIRNGSWVSAGPDWAGVERAERVGGTRLGWGRESKESWERVGGCEFSLTPPLNYGNIKCTHKGTTIKKLALQDNYVKNPETYSGCKWLMKLECGVV